MPPWVIWTLGGIGAALGGFLLLLVLLLSTKFRITIGYSDNEDLEKLLTLLCGESFFDNI